MTRKIKALVLAIILAVAVVASVGYPVTTTAYACCECPSTSC